jgi:hypothetical protein
LDTISSKIDIHYPREIAGIIWKFGKKCVLMNNFVILEARMIFIYYLCNSISIPVFYGQRSNMSVPWVYPPVWLCPAKTAVKKRRYQVVG